VPRTDPARRAAFDVLRAVADRDAYANLLLPALLTERGITGRDAAFATELTYGTLRGQGSYDAILSACSDRPVGRLDPEVRDILRLGAHQLLGTRTGAHAAVATSVDLTRQVRGHRPAGFVNAVLRRVSTRDLATWLDLVAPDRGTDEIGYLSVRHSYPRWIIEAYRAALAGRSDELEPALAAGNTRPDVTLAILPVQRSGTEVDEGDEPPPGTARARWSPFGVVLAGGGDPGELIATRRAAVQDEASQLVALALTRASLRTETKRAATTGHWLDLCAGPGGKTRLLSHLARRENARLLAVELHPHRAGRVKEALSRAAWPDAAGHADPPDDGVVVADGLRPAWQQARFDRVLADVPCTGLGSLRRRPEARWRKSPDDLPGLTSLQRGLLNAAIDSALAGGVVAYVTCSPHVAETRDIVAAVVAGRTDVELLDAPAYLPEVPDLTTPGEPRFAQFWPHRHGTDAMFLALIRRS